MSAKVCGIPWCASPNCDCPLLSARGATTMEATTKRPGDAPTSRAMAPKIGASMQTQPTAAERFTAKGRRLLSCDGDIVQTYDFPEDARRAAWAINRTGRAPGPRHYAESRRRGR